MRTLFYILFSVFFISCSAAKYKPLKINGVSFVASRHAIDSTHTKPVVNVNANAAAIMPFGFIRDINHPEIIHNTDRQWFGETRAGAKQYIEALHKEHIEVMIKPQIWVSHGVFTGLLEMNSEADWKVFETSYSNFILEYAELAEELNVEVFCIGTELETFVKNRPEYWHQLIKSIRSVYTGKLTYAANWDEFWRTPFWAELDYIGIDAYFPVSDMQTPSIEDCLKGWEKHKMGLKEFSEKLNRPIVFTEFGYRSVDYSGKEPWRYDRSMTSVNLEAQSNATQALFEAVWDEEWFAGGYLWKWFIKHHDAGGMKDNQFTPQNKPVEQIIKVRYQE
ncbi:glycoside hydrolase family 113 [Winogradskyella psychrotolerans]|uniref:glycoside hydrolase family 113 n=1 Tax=Winogradskyella psychrotolerans TaxID=1344585 RepID=UPI001C073A71|nr:glycoside hydrolase TIM-barrel-like domain-containing protein [Winogradskyella psychrotolerans]MBU2927731.1 glycoside hydrolase TIM-barrel-like domain-containing protein [Winogradskyella psychrotolerans]